MLLSALACVVRLKGWGDLTADGGFWIFQDDPPYHLRRAMMTLSSWPAVPNVDPFVNYPHGASILWPPGMAWLLAGLTKLWGTSGDPRETLQWIAALVPPAVGGLTVGLVFAGGRLLAGRGLGVLAALVLAFMPAHVQYTIVSRYDHHIFEPLITVVILLSSALAAASLGWRRWLWVAVGALGIGAGHLVWPGILFYLAFIAASLLLAVALLQRATELAGSEPALSAKSLARTAGALFAGGALCSLPALLTSPWSSVPVFFAPSPLHLACLVAAALAFFLLAYWPRSLGPGACLSRSALAVGAPAFALLLIPGMGNAAISGVQYLLASPFGQVAVESQTLAWAPRLLGTLTTWPALSCSLLAAVWLMRGAACRTWPALQRLVARERLLAAVVLASSALLLIPALTASRWITAWAPLGALGVAACWRTILAPLGMRLMPGREKRYRIWIALAALLLLVPSATYSLSLEPISADERVAQRLMGELRELTPPATDEEFSATSSPGYGVLTNWDVGHAVAYLSGRPTLANNFFGMPEYDQANGSALKILLSTDCQAAARQMRQLKLRYLLLTPIQLYHAAVILGRDPRQLVDAKGKLVRSAVKTLLGRLRAYDGESLALRLEGPAQGSKREVLEECGHFRLLAEAHMAGNSLRWPGDFKLYEVVAGARLRIRVDAGSPVELALPLQTRQGRQLVWRALRPEPEAGTVELILPYATDGSCGVVRGPCQVRPASAGGYYLRVGEWQGRVEVPAEAVEQGKTIKVDLGAVPPG